MGESVCACVCEREREKERDGERYSTVLRNRHCVPFVCSLPIVRCACYKYTYRQ